MNKEIKDLYTKTLEEEKQNNDFLKRLLEKRQELLNSIPKSMEEYNFIKNEVENINFEVNNMIFKKMF